MAPTLADASKKISNYVYNGHHLAAVEQRVHVYVHRWLPRFGNIHTKNGASKCSYTCDGNCTMEMVQMNLNECVAHTIQHHIMATCSEYSIKSDVKTFSWACTAEIHNDFIAVWQNSATTAGGHRCKQYMYSCSMYCGNRVFTLQDAHRHMTRENCPAGRYLNALSYVKVYGWRLTSMQFHNQSTELVWKCDGNTIRTCLCITHDDQLALYTDDSHSCLPLSNVAQETWYGLSDFYWPVEIPRCLLLKYRKKPTFNQGSEIVASAGSVNVTRMQMYNSLLFRCSLVSVPRYACSRCSSMWHYEDMITFRKIPSNGFKSVVYLNDPRIAHLLIGNFDKTGVCQDDYIVFCRLCNGNFKDLPSPAPIPAVLNELTPMDKKHVSLINVHGFPTNELLGRNHYILRGDCHLKLHRLSTNVADLRGLVSVIVHEKMNTSNSLTNLQKILDCVKVLKSTHPKFKSFVSNIETLVRSDDPEDQYVTLTYQKISQHPCV